MSRFTFDRSFYIPKHSTKITAKDSSAVCFISDEHGKFAAMGFRGKQQKPTFHYTFRTAERRAQYVAQFFEQARSVDDYRANIAAQRKAFVHTLQLGDVLRSMWGYDQTNIDYYEVTRVIGATVEIRKIAQESEETLHMQGKCVPCPGRYIGEPMRKRPSQGNSVKVGCSYARPIPATVVAGAKVYEASHWTAYH